MHHSLRFQILESTIHSLYIGAFEKTEASFPRKKSAIHCYALKKCTTSLKWHRNSMPMTRRNRNVVRGMNYFIYLNKSPVWRTILMPTYVLFWWVCRIIYANVGIYSLISLKVSTIEIKIFFAGNRYRVVWNDGRPRMLSNIANLPNYMGAMLWSMVRWWHSI